MKRTILLLCVVSVLSWAAGSALAQGKGKQREDRTVNKANENAAAAEKKAEKATTPQDVEKAAKEKGKGAMDQAQTKGKSAKDQAADKAAEAKGKGKDQAQQLRALDKQIQHETAKHMEREARLARIRELAVKKNDTKTVEQVDQLIAKEKQRYEAKLLKMQAEKRAGGTLPPTDVQKPKGGKGKVEKPAGEAAKPAETKPEAQTPPPAAGGTTAGGQAAPAPAPAPSAPTPVTPPAPEPNAPKPQ